MNQYPCQDDPDLWFPVGFSGPAIQQEELAKEGCAVCPIQAECLTTALQNGCDHGVWGGTSPAERRHLLSRNPALARKEPNATTLTVQVATPSRQQAPGRVGQPAYRS